MYNKIINKENI